MQKREGGFNLSNCGEKMNKNIYLISWYFPSFSGGAEKSILQELKKYQKNGYNISVICFDEYYPRGKFNIDGISGINYGLKLQFLLLLVLIFYDLCKKMRLDNEKNLGIVSRLE